MKPIRPPLTLFTQGQRASKDKQLRIDRYLPNPKRPRPADSTHAQKTVQRPSPDELPVVPPPDLSPAGQPAVATVPGAASGTAVTAFSSSLISSLSLESYIQLYSALTKGQQLVQPVSTIEEPFYKIADLKALLDAHGLVFTRNKKRELLDRIEGLRLVPPAQQQHPQSHHPGTATAGPVPASGPESYGGIDRASGAADRPGQQDHQQQPLDQQPQSQHVLLHTPQPQQQQQQPQRSWQVPRVLESADVAALLGWAAPGPGGSLGVASASTAVATTMPASSEALRVLQENMQSSTMVDLTIPSALRAAAAEPDAADEMSESPPPSPLPPRPQRTMTAVTQLQPAHVGVSKEAGDGAWALDLETGRLDFELDPDPDRDPHGEPGQQQRAQRSAPSQPPQQRRQQQQQQQQQQQRNTQLSRTQQSGLCSKEARRPACPEHPSRDTLAVATALRRQQLPTAGVATAAAAAGQFIREAQACAVVQRQGGELRGRAPFVVTLYGKGGNAVRHGHRAGAGSSGGGDIVLYGRGPQQQVLVLGDSVNDRDYGDARGGDDAYTMYDTGNEELKVEAEAVGLEHLQHPSGLVAGAEEDPDIEDDGRDDTDGEDEDDAEGEDDADAGAEGQGKGGSQEARLAVAMLPWLAPQVVAFSRAHAASSEPLISSGQLLGRRVAFALMSHFTYLDTRAGEEVLPPGIYQGRAKERLGPGCLEDVCGQEGCGREHDFFFVRVITQPHLTIRGRLELKLDLAPHNRVTEFEQLVYACGGATPGVRISMTAACAMWRGIKRANVGTAR